MTTSQREHAADDRTGIDLPARGATVDVPPAASPGEAAAVAAAIGAYLHDEHRAVAAAAAAAAAESTGPESIDRWTLAGRYGARDAAELPREVRRGEEWKMAGRLRRRR